MGVQLDRSGYLDGTHRIDGKAALLELLRAWLAGGAATLGDPELDRRTPIVRGTLGPHAFVLHADTTRKAVERVLELNSPTIQPWLVTTSRRGRLTRVAPESRGQPLPGWYCYVSPELDDEAIV